MHVLRLAMKYRLIITIIPALIGIGSMIYYATCTTSCSYLQGDIFGIDLKYIGPAYMIVIIALALLKQADLIRLLVAAGLGSEVFLVAFQIKENVFCPYCLTFGLMIVLMYIINYERRGLMNSWYSKLIYAFGDAKLPFIRNVRFPLLGMMLIGYIFISFTFTGSATPAFAGTPDASAPSYGKGAWELIIFTDYFCPPCQNVEKDLEPEIARLLARGDIKITFVDFPGHKPTSLYSRYFLASVAANQGYENVIKARNILFYLAAKNVEKESALNAALKDAGVSLKTVDPKPYFKDFMDLIRRYDINQTPTCVLRFSSTYKKMYAGSDQIQGQLIPELKKKFPEGKK